MEKEKTMMERMLRRIIKQRWGRKRILMAMRYRKIIVII